MLALFISSVASAFSAPIWPIEINEVLKGYGYVSSEGKVKIKFPAEYVVEESPGESHVTTKVSATMGEMNFFLSYTIHETEITSHYEMAELSLSTFEEKLSARSLSQGDYIYKSHTGRMAEMMMDEQGIRLFYRAILVDQIQYQLIVTMPADQAGNASLDAFFKSFKLLK